MSSVSEASKGVLSLVQTRHLRYAVDDTRNTVSGLKCFMKDWASSVVKVTRDWEKSTAAQRVELEDCLHREQECSKETQLALNTCKTEAERKIQELTITISRLTGEMTCCYIRTCQCPTLLQSHVTQCCTYVVHAETFYSTTIACNWVCGTYSVV